MVIRAATAQTLTTAPPTDFSWKTPPGLAEGLAALLLSAGVAYLGYRWLRPHLRRVRRTLASVTLGVLLFGSIVYWQTATNRALGWTWHPPSMVLDNITQIRAVWVPERPSDDPLTALRRLTIDPRDEEATRRSVRDLRVALQNGRNIFGTSAGGFPGAIDLTAWRRALPAQKEAIISVIERLDPTRFIHWAAQWEVLRLKQVLMTELVATMDTRSASSAELAPVADVMRHVTTVRYPHAAANPLLLLLIKQGNVEFDPDQWLDRVAYRDGFFGWVGLVEQLAQNANNPFLRDAAKALLPKIENLPAEPANFAGLCLELDAVAALYPTRQSFEEASRFYQTLKEGPERPIDIADLEEVQFARRTLKPWVPYYRDSGAYHHVSPNFAAAVALTHLLFDRDNRSIDGNLYMGFYDAFRGREHEHPWLRLFVEAGKPLFSRIIIQDRYVEYFGGPIAKSQPTIGAQQIRVTPTGAPWEINILKNHLWARWMSDEEVRAHIRDLNWQAMNPQWNIEAGMTQYAQTLEESEKSQDQGELPAIPDLRSLAANDWFAQTYDPARTVAGPDFILAPMWAYMSQTIPGWSGVVAINNSIHSWIRQWPAHARIMVLESGIFDSADKAIPAKIVGLTSVQQLDILYRLALGQPWEEEAYFRDAAWRSLEELARDRGFPGQRQAAEFVQLYRPVTKSHESLNRGGRLQSLLRKISKILTVAEGFLGKNILTEKGESMVRSYRRQYQLSA